MSPDDDQGWMTSAAVPPAGPMQHLLSHFCEALEHGLAPLLSEIDGLLEALDRAPTEAPTVLPELRELADQLTLLVDKMAEQQAYVLIFGPLKSGKSTLMNAICGKYVSEVSSLPAYPCLVHVAHAESTHCRIIRYDGSVQVLDDESALADAVKADHEILVQAIRRCEAEGVDFEPQEHAANAIRRIDVRIPAGDLAQSGTVLVDTPGLYSRMKFGYDRMTRDFRNAAACAIFVVKTDNLFLDQVFAEFEDLLELFERIFLVINLDSTKQDLQPDGSLAPSLEHADPQAVVRAFEDLAMTAALRNAREDGRLQIYPVDLQRAASRRIRWRARRQGTPGAVDDEDFGVLLDDLTRSLESDDFSVLLDDLTRYLNSNEYLRNFVGDSLQRAGVLLNGLGAALGHDEIEALHSRCATLVARRQGLQAAIDALKRIAAVDFGRQARNRSDALAMHLVDEIDVRRADAARALADTVDAWFGEDSSLQEFCRSRFASRLEHFQLDLVDLLSRAAERHLGPDVLLGALPSGLASDLELAEVDLADVVRERLEDVPPGRIIEPPEARVDGFALPVRRRWADWLLFRKAMTVRRRFFGPPEAPDAMITARDKSRRLGDKGRAALLEQLEKRIRPMFTGVTGPTLDDWVVEHLDGLGAALAARCEARRRVLEAEIGQVVEEWEVVQAVVDRVGELRRKGIDRQELVGDLVAELESADPAVLRSADDGFAD